MRILIVLVVATLWTGTATAENCEARLAATNLDLSLSIECLVGEVQALKKRVAALESKLAEQEKDVPVEYVNVDGTANVDSDRNIMRAVFTLNARQTGRASSLPLEMALVERLCAPRAACTLSLYYRTFGFRSDAPVDTVATDPCRLEYDAKNGAWSRSPGCGSKIALSGIDGDQAIGGAVGGGEVIGEAAGACILADSDINLRGLEGTEELGRDHAKGLFLIAVPSRQLTPARRFQCELLIE